MSPDGEVEPETGQLASSPIPSMPALRPSTQTSTEAARATIRRIRARPSRIRSLI